MSVPPSLQVANDVIEALVSSGTTEFAYCPGSRNAPFAYVLAAQEAAGRVRVHAFAEERGAAFWALGAAQALGAVHHDDATRSRIGDDGDERTVAGGGVACPVRLEHDAPHGVPQQVGEEFSADAGEQPHGCDADVGESVHPQAAGLRLPRCCGTHDDVDAGDGGEDGAASGAACANVSTPAATKAEYSPKE